MEDDGGDDGEDGRIGADTQGESHDRGGREARALPYSPQGETEVLKETIHKLTLQAIQWPPNVLNNQWRHCGLVSGIEQLMSRFWIVPEVIWSTPLGNFNGLTSSQKQDVLNFLRSL